LTTIIVNNSIYKTKNMESKIIDITNCKPYKKRLLAVENAILIRYNYQTEKTRD